MTTPLSSLYPTSSLSGPSLEFRAFWAVFVKLVLEITVEAYQRMRQDAKARRDWEENQFSRCLTQDYLQPLARQQPLALVAEPRVRVYSEGLKKAMKDGHRVSQRAPEIDIKIFIPTWDYDRVYFAWECKRVADKQKSKEYAKLVAEYVPEGILRFINEEYAVDLDDAGMLGYVLAGDVSTIVQDINASIRRPHRTYQLSAKDCLASSCALGSFQDAYQSNHERFSSHKSVRLHHLFLTFDFDLAK